MTANRYSRYGIPLRKADVRLDINPALLAIQDEVDAINVEIGDIQDQIDNLAPEDQVDFAHAPILTPSFHNGLPGNTPTPAAKVNLVYLVFGNNNLAYQQLRVPVTYVSTPAFHIHWTKSGDGNESGKAVRWRVSYVVFPSNDLVAGDGTIAPTVAEVEDTYDDNGTTTRKVYKTASVPMVGIVAGQYISLAIQAVTPSGSPLSSDPGLFSLDFTYLKYVNKVIPDG